MDFLDNCDILKLSELLNPKKENDSDSDEEVEEINTEASCNTDTEKKQERKQSVYTKITPRKVEQYDPLNPESEDALYFDDKLEQASDWKKTPQWTVSYNQQVTATDVFLQMGPKNTSTACCEDMILNITLPEEDYHNIDLKIAEKHISLTSPKYILKTPLPHSIDPKFGDAKWDTNTENLIVTLRMNREFDYINF